jgi:carbonic anhydrase
MTTHLKVILITFLSLCLFSLYAEEKHAKSTTAPTAKIATTKEEVSLSPDMAFAKLKEGNARFAKGKPLHPDQSVETRQELSKGQKPFAVIVACSDSRLSPEIIFDQGLGDLFVIRIAGNTVGDAALGSIEYAVEHLGCQLVIVMGHDKCGAVKAAVEGVTKGNHPHEHIIALTAPILPVVSEARFLKGDLLENSIKLNAQNQASILKKSQPVLEEKIAEKKTKSDLRRLSLQHGFSGVLGLNLDQGVVVSTKRTKWDIRASVAILKGADGF